MTKLTFSMLVCGLTFFAPTHSNAATLSGTFDASGDFIIGATFLNFICDHPGNPACTPVPANQGDFLVNNGATGTFAQYSNTFGLVKDINDTSEPLNTPVSLMDFMTFELNANETIELNLIPLGTDTPSTTCAGLAHCTPENAALVTPNNPLGLSPFNLDQNATGVSATFGFMGTLHDSSGTTIPLSGTFTTQFDGATPQSALAQFVAAGAGGLDKAYSVEVSVVPEPMTVSLLGAGLLGLGLLGRRLRRS